MNNQQYTNITTPSNYYGTTGLPNKNKKTKTIFAIIGLAVVLVIALIIILASVTGNNQNGPELSEARENTPTLQLYASLENEMTLEDIEKAANSANAGFEVATYDDGTGTVRIPEKEDYLIFDYDIEENEDEEEYDSTYTINQVTLQPDEIIYNIRYVFEIGDDGYFISFSEDSGMYQVFDFDEVFDYSTKKEAIEAFLAPVVTE